MSLFVNKFGNYMYKQVDFIIYYNQILAYC